MYQLYILSYLLGSVPFGLIMAYLFAGEDIRKQGSGNIGATNAFRVSGKAIGIATLILDVGKGALPVLLAQYLYPDIWFVPYVCGALALIGHIFPIWLGFKGGKGVATALGMVLALNYYLALVAFSTWIIIFLFSRLVSLASVLASLAAIISVWIMTYCCNLANSTTATIITAVCVLVIIRHKKNLERIIKNKEKRLF